MRLKLGLGYQLASSILGILFLQTCLGIEGTAEGAQVIK